MSQYGWALWGAIQAGASSIDFDCESWGRERFEKAARTFTSPELDVACTLSAQTGTLVLRIPGRTNIALRPIAPDLFAGPLVGALRFTRDRTGTLAGFTIRAHGALGVRFTRLPG